TPLALPVARLIWTFTRRQAVRLLGDRRPVVPALGERLVTVTRIPHGEHGARGVAHDALGDAAEHRVEPADPAVRAHHDQIEPLARGLHDLREWIAVTRAPRHAIAERGARAADGLVHDAFDLVASARDHDIARGNDVEHFDLRIMVLGERQRVIERGERRCRTIERDENGPKDGHASPAMHRPYLPTTAPAIRGRRTPPSKMFGAGERRELRAGAPRRATATAREG